MTPDVLESPASFAARLETALGAARTSAGPRRNGSTGSSENPQFATLMLRGPQQSETPETKNSKNHSGAKGLIGG